MYVIGTAGHVDHGKSTLIRALTGIDPDRLREEKERGLTIELGFAWLPLPSGIEVSIVDVPGHERFVKNMLMGVGGIDLALLIVAADEGVMPQTREHLAILDLLRVERAIVVITKKDLVDDELLELVQLDVEELLAGTGLSGSPMVAVSAEEGEGLGDLISAIDRVLTEVPARADVGRPRLPVDRSFSMSGFGAVVTGTLAGGRLRTGTEVEILPSRKRARIRGLQTHERSVDEALPGTRVAVNLSGIDRLDIERGDVIAAPRWLSPTLAFDAEVRAVVGAPRPIRHNHRLILYSGTRETDVTVRLLSGDEIGAGESGWAQIRATEPVPIVAGDLFVLRDTQDTLGGGRVLEVDAVRHRRNHAATIRRLEALAGGSAREIVLQAIGSLEPASVATIARQANLSETEVGEVVAGLVAEGGVVSIGAGLSASLFTAGGWQKVRETAVDALRDFHARFPLRMGMPREELRGRLRLQAVVFQQAVIVLAGADAIVAEGAYIRLPGHRPDLTAEQERGVADYLERLASNRYSPPTDVPIDSEVLALLIERGEVVRASEDVVFLFGAYDEMKQRIIEHATGGGEISISSVREMFDTSRKYTLALLEALDRENITRRDGDLRSLR